MELTAFRIVCVFVLTLRLIYTSYLTGTSSTKLKTCNQNLWQRIIAKDTFCHMSFCFLYMGRALAAEPRGRWTNALPLDVHVAVDVRRWPPPTLKFPKLMVPNCVDSHTSPVNWRTCAWQNTFKHCGPSPTDTVESIPVCTNCPTQPNLCNEKQQMSIVKWRGQFPSCFSTLRLTISRIHRKNNIKMVNRKVGHF